MRKTTMAASVALAGLLLISGCSDTTPKKRTTEHPVANTVTDQNVAIPAGDHDVQLDAVGAGNADVAYAVGTDRGQDAGTVLPWHKTTKFTGTGVVSMMVVVPQAGDLSCRITVDGVVLSETKAAPGVVSVNCQAG